MKVLEHVAVVVTAGLVLGACSPGGDSPGNSTSPGTTRAAEASVPFKEARLIVETNATDGDAGLQLFLDHEPWKSIALFRPDGSKILDITTRSDLAEYGLTELFSESSEPPFEKFPLDEFKKLFPAGEYRLTGATIEGQTMESLVTLTHDFPAGPKILSPTEDARVAPGELVVRWEAVAEPKGIDIVGYQVLVTREKPLRVFSVDLTATATTLQVPAEFLEQGGEYKVEVLAIEKNRNQTLTEVTFKIG